MSLLPRRPEPELITEPRGARSFVARIKLGDRTIGSIAVNRTQRSTIEFFDETRPSGKRWHDVRGDEWTVTNVLVEPAFRRARVATTLYEAAAREVRRRGGAFFASDTIRSEASQGFWQKQERKHPHKVRFLGDRYVMLLAAMPAKIDLGRVR